MIPSGYKALRFPLLVWATGYFGADNYYYESIECCMTKEEVWFKSENVIYA